MCVLVKALVKMRKSMIDKAMAESWHNSIRPWVAKNYGGDDEIKTLFRDWLAAHEPMKAGRVLRLIRDARAGRLNDPEFGSRMSGSGPYAALIARRFTLACERLGLNTEPPQLDVARFHPPPRQRRKRDQAQLELL